jgi:hypothetical protein
MHRIDPSNLHTILPLSLSVKVVISLVCVKFLMRALRRHVIARDISGSYNRYLHYQLVCCRLSCSGPFHSGSINWYVSFS